MAKRKKWPEQKIAGLLFARSTDMLKFIDRLIRRSRFTRNRLSYPFICFIDDWPDANILDGIEYRLLRRSRIPSARVASRPTSAHDDRIANIRALLDAAVADYSEEFPRVRRFRFPHYAVATWLLYLKKRKEEADAAAHDDANTSADQISDKLDDELREFFRRRSTAAAAARDLPNIVEDFPSWIRSTARILPSLALVLMRSSWRPPRWFRNRLVGNVRGGSFSGLARSFAEWNPETISVDAICELLVDAFLEDLRRMYRRTSFLGAGRRRTAHPVMILESACGDTVGLQLLSHIAKIRNTRLRQKGGRRHPSDPLLIITCGDATTRKLLDWSSRDTSTGWPYSVTEIAFAYSAWSSIIADAGFQQRRWLLPLRIPVKPAVEPPAIRTDIIDAGLPDTVPVFAPAALALVVGASVIVGYQHLEGTCGALPWEPQMTLTDPKEGPVECVGLASNRFRFFANIGDVQEVPRAVANGLINVEELITKANERIQRRPHHLTIVYLGILTPVEFGSYSSELEQLRGIAVAQAESELGGTPFRVLLANAGDSFKHGVIAGEAIIQSRESERIVAAVGLGISKKETAAAMAVLAQGRTPMVGSLISATDLATRTTQYYHQVGPTNAREAAILAYYGQTRLQAKRATVYYSGDNDDLYSTDLAAQLRIALPNRGIQVAEEQYQVGGQGFGTDLATLGRKACILRNYNGVAIYAGRAEQFGEFLQGMKSRCEGLYPKLLVSDDITRFSLRSGFANYPNLVVNYVSFASSLAWGEGCDTARQQTSFYERYYQMFGDCLSTRDGTAPMSYDSLFTLAQAVGRATADTTTSPSGDLILGKLNELTPENSVSGATGEIGYVSDYGNGRVPVNKTTLILEVEGSQAPRRVLLCGQLKTAQPAQDPNCPIEN